MAKKEHTYTASITKEATCTESGLTEGKKCSACGVTTEGESYHSYTKTTEITATCVEKGTSRYTCNCGYTYTSKDIAINPGNHAGPTVYGGTQDCHTKCNACGTTLSSTHTYNQTKVESKYLKSVANCVDKAVYYKSCICGYSDKSATFTTGDVNPNNHKGPDTYGGTKACHIKCGACGVTLQGESYHEMKVVPGGTSATCTKEGAVVYKCDCGYGYTTTVNKLGHAPASDATWNADHSVATVVCTRSGCTAKWSGNSTVNVISNATCTSANTYNHKATFNVNGTTKTFTCPTTHSGSALGHLISNPPKNITWTNDNKRVTITCERSGCGQTWTYDLVEGNGEITDVVNPTCTTTGSYKCIIKVTINGNQYSFKCPGHTTAALGHAPATTATWTTDHSKATVKCTRTGCSKTWSGNSTEVTIRNATCTVTRQYYHSATFSVNGTSKTFKCPTTHTGSTHSHTWSYTCDTTCNCCGCTRNASHNMVQTKAPTCTATGTKTCSYGCGTTSTIAALGHDFSSKTTTSTYLKSAATCTAPAYYYYKCSRCTAKGSSTYSSGTSLGHDYSSTSSKYSWASGCTSCTATRACGRSGCSYVLTETKSASVRRITDATCSDKGKYDYYVENWSSSYFGLARCPCYHYDGPLGHSLHTSYNYTLGYALLFSHEKVVSCLRCGYEESKGMEGHHMRSDSMGWWCEVCIARGNHLWS